MTGDQMTRTSGTLPVAEHLRPQPAFQHLDLCPKYTRLRLPSPFAVHWTTVWIDLDEAASLIIAGEA
jgi:hypothetical protein